MRRPLPPFRAKPSRRPSAPKRFFEGRSETAISVKAARLPIRFTRLLAAPALKVLALPAAHS